MKKIFLILLAVASVVFSITAQEIETMYVMKNGIITHEIAIPDIDSIVFYNPVLEDGFYVVGAATSTPNLQDANASKALMAVGFSEFYQSSIYVKYLALEGGKPFSIVLKDDDTEISYGANLTLTALVDEDEPAISVYKGKFAKNGAALYVAENGLYHVIINLNMTEPIIIIAPVSWGIRGTMNDWGFSAFPTPAFNKTSMTFMLQNFKISTGSQFKYAYGGGWSIWLHEDGYLREQTNLGGNGENGLTPGGYNINIAAGIWDIELTWNLAGGNVTNSFKDNLTKTGSVNSSFDSNTVFSLVGTAVMDWDTDLDFTFISNTDNHIIYKAKNVTLMPGEFKVRTNHGWNWNWGWGQVSIEGEGFWESAGYGNIETAGGFFSEVIFEFDWNEKEGYLINPKLKF